MNQKHSNVIEELIHGVTKDLFVYECPNKPKSFLELRWLQNNIAVRTSAFPIKNSRQ